MFSCEKILILSVRILTLLFSRDPGAVSLTRPLAALWNMLPKLSNLHTIHIITCQTPRLAKSLVDPELKLPGVMKLFLPNEGAVFLGICPNAVHVRCVDGSGVTLLSSLTSKTEIFEGMADWTDPLVLKRQCILLPLFGRHSNN
jgi:hypothetical protein